MSRSGRTCRRSAGRGVGGGFRLRAVPGGGLHRVLRSWQGRPVAGGRGRPLRPGPARGRGGGGGWWNGSGPPTGRPAAGTRTRTRAVRTAASSGYGVCGPCRAGPVKGAYGGALRRPFGHPDIDQTGRLRLRSRLGVRNVMVSPAGTASEYPTADAVRARTPGGVLARAMRVTSPEPPFDHKQIRVLVRAPRGFAPRVRPPRVGRASAPPTGSRQVPGGRR